MATIKNSIESARGCGYRKKGGIYFVSEGIAAPCDKLPIPLTVCPCCNAGIKQSRGFTWISSQLFEVKPCDGNCERCPMNLKDLRLGLMWVGEKYYPTVDAFNREAFAMGVSKRISQIPKDFKVGETWIALAHPKAVVTEIVAGVEIGYAPGVFRAFKPDRIEYVVTGNETEEELDRLEKRGFTLINVIPDTDAQKSMQFENEEAL